MPCRLGDSVSADAITVCDLTGTGVQDTAIAGHAFETLVGTDP